MKNKSLTKLLGVALSLAFLAGCSRAGTATSTDTAGNGPGDSGGNGQSHSGNPPPTHGKGGPGGTDSVGGSEQTFRGYVQHRSDKSTTGELLGVTPITIGLRFSKISPTQTTITETINVGFFGGVKISTDQVTVDVSTDKLIARFGTGANPLQVTARWNGTQILEAQLDGPNSGKETIQILEQVSDASLPLNQNIYDFSFGKPNMGDMPKDSGKKPTKGNKPKPAPKMPTGRVVGRLALIPQVGAVVSNGASDLPLLPSLNASLALDGEGELVTPIPTVMYDPLRGTIEMQLANRNMYRLEHVYVDPTKTTWGSDPVSMGGTVLAGSSPYATIAAKASSSKTLPFGTLSRSFFYSGKMTTSEGVTQNVTANLVNLNQIGTNTADYIMPTFPVLQLRVSFCAAKGVEMGRSSFTLAGLEPIFTQAKFTEDNATESTPAIASFGYGWSSVSMIVHEAGSGGTEGGTDIKVDLKQNAHQTSEPCQ